MSLRQRCDAGRVMMPFQPGGPGGRLRFMQAAGDVVVVGEGASVVAGLPHRSARIHEYRKRQQLADSSERAF